MELLSFKKAKETFNANIFEQSCKDLFRLREEFVNIFSIDKIASMKIEEYVVGLQNRNSFCYWLERTLHSLGNISGQASFKFGIWYSPSKETYCFQAKFGDNYEEAFKNVKSAILELLIAGEKKDYNNYFTLGEKIKSVTWVDNGESVNFTQDGDKVNVIPSPFRYGQDLVVRIAKIEI